MINNREDYAKQCFDYTINELKKISYQKLSIFRPYKNVEMEKLLSYFEDNDCFLQLNEEMQMHIMKEIHYRICDKFNAPYFNVIFEKYDDLDKECFNCGATDYRQRIVINLFTQKALNKLPKNKKDTVGLNYLDTIIHETRHAIQYNYMIDLLKGNSVPLPFAFIGLDTILSNVIENAKIKNFSECPSDQFYLCGAEIDARIFANNVILDFANSKMFKDNKRAKEFANGGNFIACALEKDNQSMALSYVARLKKLIKNMQSYVDLSNYNEFRFVLDNDLVMQYEKSLIDIENKNANLLIDYYKEKLQELKDNYYINEFMPKINENLNAKNLLAIQSLIEQAKALTELDFFDINEFYGLNFLPIKNLGNQQLFMDKIKTLGVEYSNQLKKERMLNRVIKQNINNFQKN